jgi:dipeptidyl aminopeptidase/acylaminoacyl peptidase
MSAEAQSCVDPTSEQNSVKVIPEVSGSIAAAPGSVRPHGSWPSPISAASLVQGSRGLGGLCSDGDFLYWLESRPEESGRTTIMRWHPGSEPEDILPAPFNARSRVHEYGGGSLLVAGGVLWFSNFADQRVYRFIPGQEPCAITPDAALRYAGYALDSTRERLICIREDHRNPGEPVNTLVALQAMGMSEGEVLFSGTDFVSAPRLSPDGTRIAFTSWNHPNMPWDETSLYSASFDGDGGLAELTLHNPDCAESVLDPQWSIDNQLYALTDRDNWWQPYRVRGLSLSAALAGVAGFEIGGPDWSIDTRYYQLLEDGSLLAIARRGSVEELLLIAADGNQTRIDAGAVSYACAQMTDGQLYFIAGFASQPAAIVAADTDGTICRVIRRASDTALDPEWVPDYLQLSFDLPDGSQTHGVYHPPSNPDVGAPDGTAPPLIVSVHGGPTSVAGLSYRPEHYYWTSRGFAVLDLNHRGSTGFGREYRRALYGQWGVADVEDAAIAAMALAQQGLADARRLIIRGGRAGGFTTLAAHAFFDTFAAGASYYGISDIEALARDTHKFESRYLDQLIGPYPARRDLYLDRSPIHHLEGFRAPLLLLQGLEDPVVPPNQSEMIYEALKARGIPTAYLAFAGEAHGFRKANNQIVAREAELFFYAKVLGLEPADALPGIVIEHLGDAMTQ